MSSTGKTPKLGLCQWELSDQFRMEDMNEDFRKIDEELGGMSRKKLFDVTVKEKISSVQLDFSDVDLERFAELEMHFNFATDSKYMRVNGVTDNKYSHSNYSGGSWGNKLPVSPGTGHLCISVKKMIFHLIGDLSTGRMNRADFPQLVTIEFFAENASYYFQPDDRISVWGVVR